MPKVNIGLDAELVVEVMVLAGVRSAQDAVEVVLRDYIERGHRTEAVTGSTPEERREVELRPPQPEG